MQKSPQFVREHEGNVIVSPRTVKKQPIFCVPRTKSTILQKNLSTHNMETLSSPHLLVFHDYHFIPENILTKNRNCYVGEGA